MSYKDTLNLPRTDFPIKSNYSKREPELLDFWYKGEIYEKTLDKNKELPKFILHDGPPYPNGDIHLGHALNKILKDIIVKYKLMTGFYAPIQFGWDCHGLPIETQLLKELGVRRQEMSAVEFRKKCREYALKFVDLQRNEFKRLAVMGQWEEPYLTLNFEYEEKVIELFGVFAEQGYVYKGLKPIHWCPNCETALAEAEIEYEDEKSHSIYVRFKVLKEPRLQSQVLSNEPENKFSAPEPRIYSQVPTFFIIWTTTPWTLPSNVAIAIHPEFNYLKIKVEDKIFVVAEGLLNDFLSKTKLKDYHIIETMKGTELEGIICRHPFAKRDVPVVLDQLVTLEQGTGAVHIAPGHGVEDYQVGLKYKLPIIMPVDSKGFYTEGAGKYKGLRYDKANQIIIDDMRAGGALIHDETIMHSYPHCWRCKKPVIFRATEQWFISVDHKDLRQKALKAIGETKWYPSWGENRIAGMVCSRPDWCISRQRSWGVPIPAFYCKKCGKPNFTGKFNEAVRNLVSAEGTDGWFKKSAAEILPAGIKCINCGSSSFEKETDIMDVWLESGSSHYCVLEENSDLHWPADLYLEGSDQHRGWFQSSLLTSVGWRGRAPYNAVLTHGFTVDESGKKMSKSLGNVVDPQSVVKEYGADVLRLWVASADFRSDMSASRNILRHVADAYGKIRNTCRFLISNIYDFDPNKDLIIYEKLFEMDQWIISDLNKLVNKVRDAYDSFEFHVVFHSIHSFCVNELSAYYLDMIKDRLYCDRKDSLSRRAAQTVIYELLMTLVNLMAPILSFTAEDIYQTTRPPDNQTARPSSIFLCEMPKSNPKYENLEIEKKWEKIFEVREDIYRALEAARSGKKITSSLEAEVEIYADGEIKNFIEQNLAVLTSALMVSKVVMVTNIPDDATSGQKFPNISVVAHKTNYKKCERCWMSLESVGENGLCARCSSLVSVI